jgi:CheY-like chemotaxis protein/HPt (histidine-containing phosphotransfer) domain-containing protein
VLIDSNPVHWRELISAVAVSIGREVITDDQNVVLEEFGGWVPPSIEEARQRGELVLVAEDNVINQQVIRRQLNGLGRACEVVDDGVAAIEKLRQSQYAMLLTDCDMPNMDGYELTRQIRNEESESIHLPIVAITANAIDGAVEDCLAAGMDDYIAKPVQMSELHRILEVFMPRKEAPALLPDVELAADQASPKVEANESDRILDASSLTTIFGEDKQAVKELLEEFIVSSEETMTDLCVAVDEESADQIRSSAHKLKSAARTVGAHVLADLCEAIEAVAKGKDWIKINEAVPEALIAFSLVRDRIQKGQ